MIQKYYTLGKYGRNRIFMTAVLGYNFKTQRFVPAPNVWETSFANRKELVDYLAEHTVKHGCFRPTGDPDYWTNPMIDRQASKSKATRTWLQTSELPYRYWDEGNWDLWFHDAYGKTIDVRKFWSEVIAEVQRRLQSFEQRGATKRMWRWRRRGHTRTLRGYHPGKGRAGWGTYFRNFSDSREYVDDEENLLYRWTPRGKIRMNVWSMYERCWDWLPLACSRHSVGWKDYKRRHQWEHRVREQEKHRRNRERKAICRNGYFAENE